MKNLLAVLNRIKQAELTLNKEKCIFTMSIKFLGQVVIANGIKPDPDKITTINNMPQLGLHGYCVLIEAFKRRAGLDYR